MVKHELDQFPGGGINFGQTCLSVHMLHRRWCRCTMSSTQPAASGLGKKDLVLQSMCNPSFKRIAWTWWRRSPSQTYHTYQSHRVEFFKEGEQPAAGRYVGTWVVGYLQFEHSNAPMLWSRRSASRNLLWKKLRPAMAPCRRRRRSRDPWQPKVK